VPAAYRERHDASQDDPPPMSAPAHAIRMARLADGERIPVLAQGTQGYGDSERRRRAIAALRAGIDLGMTAIDAAPDAEALVGAAIARRRDEVFLIARLAPRDATRAGMAMACAASLRRLGAETLDLYLLHGRGRVPLDESVQGFEALRTAGTIRHWGVADFGLPGLAELLTLGARCAADEVRYDLAHRQAEWDLRDACRERGVALLAATVAEPPAHPRLYELARRHAVTPSQIALAWLLSHEDLVAIAPSETPEQVERNRAAAELRLDGHDHALLNDAFPPPLGPQPLERL
jgi:diketogulonate reductase-like aldo/keto reductase